MLRVSFGGGKALNKNTVKRREPNIIKELSKTEVN